MKITEDWDINLIKQRSNPWGKRLQLLYRIMILMKKYKQEQQKNSNVKSSKDSN